jgi:circadian clock protein KaiB
MEAIIKLRLYVAGNSPNSVKAIANLGVLCRENLPDRHHIEIVDVFREPKRALADGIILTPMLLKLSPSPACQVMGDLSHPTLVLQTLGLSPST